MTNLEILKDLLNNNPQVKLIGVSGKKQNGKDTLYDLFVENMGFLFKDIDPKINTLRLSFASPLKEEIYKFVLKPNGIPREALDDERKKNFRLILQGYGTDFKRNMVSDDIWVRKLEEEMIKIIRKHLLGKNKASDLFLFVTDVRFLQEAKWIETLGGKLLRVNRYYPWVLPRIKQLIENFRERHESEIALDKYVFDHVFKNTTKAEYAKQIRSYFTDSFH